MLSSTRAISTSTRRSFSSSIFWYSSSVRKVTGLHFDLRKPSVADSSELVFQSIAFAASWPAPPNKEKNIMPGTMFFGPPLSRLEDLRSLSPSLALTKYSSDHSGDTTGYCARLDLIHGPDPILSLENLEGHHPRCCGWLECGLCRRRPMAHLTIVTRAEREHLPSHNNREECRRCRSEDSRCRPSK
jgi:hypothetical protein